MAKATAQPAKKAPLIRLDRILPGILIICGIIGLVASLAITNDKFILASNPDFQTGCDINPIISCGSVMKSEQAHAFGFMNTYIGLIGFPIVITTGMAMLAGARFKRWWWLGMQVGLTFGIIFAYWLLWQSMYRLHALCPWCLSVDASLPVAFWYVTLYNFYNGNLRLPARFKSVGRFVKRHHVDILLLGFIVVIAVILQHFWYYFGRNL